MSKFKKYFQIQNPQKGVSLMIVFLVMVIMLSIVIGVLAILYFRSGIGATIANSQVAANYADTGGEGLLYHYKQGFCNTCNDCSPGSTRYNCNNCTLTPVNLGGIGCNISTCGQDQGCSLTYSINSPDTNSTVSATLTPGSCSGASVLSVVAKGYFGGATIETDFTKTGAGSCLTDADCGATFCLDGNINGSVCTAGCCSAPQVVQTCPCAPDPTACTGGSGGIPSACAFNILGGGCNNPGSGGGPGVGGPGGGGL